VEVTLISAKAQLARVKKQPVDFQVHNAMAATDIHVEALNIWPLSVK
jgi:hypothetical protein